MGDWVGLAFIVLLFVGALAGLSHLGRPPKPLSREEYERRAAEGRGLMSAGMMAGVYALQKVLNPKAVEAIEVQRDLKAGFYDDEEKEGEGEEPGPKDGALKPKGGEGEDA